MFNMDIKKELLQHALGGMRYTLARLMSYCITAVCDQFMWDLNPDLHI